MHGLFFACEERTMKKLFVVFAAMLLLVMMGCSSSESATAPGVLDSYTQALKAGDNTKALESVSTSAQDRQRQAFELMDQASKQKLADAMSNATKEYEDDFKIKYRFTMRLDDGSTVEDTFWIILEDGSWKIIGL
jgi:uncharacterized protein YcfL